MTAGVSSRCGESEASPAKLWAGRNFCTLTVVLLLAAISCQHPDAGPRPLGGRPLAVRLDCHGGDPDRGIDECYGEALRNRLANQAQVLSKDQAGTTGFASLVVHLRILDSRAKVVGNAALDGFTSGFSSGWKATGKTGSDPKSTLTDAAAGVVVGTLFGVVAAPVNAATAEARAIYHNARLGYKPRHVVVKVSLIPGPDQAETPLFETTAFEIVKAMRPMKNAEAREPGRLMKEEAYALAKVVSTHMERDFAWKPGPQPRRNPNEGENPL